MKSHLFLFRNKLIVILILILTLGGIAPSNLYLHKFIIRLYGTLCSSGTTTLVHLILSPKDHAFVLTVLVVVSHCPPPPEKNKKTY